VNDGVREGDTTIYVRVLCYTYNIYIYICIHISNILVDMEN